MRHMGQIFTHSPFATPNSPEGKAPSSRPGEASMIPPPPPSAIEVAIRTMETDVDLMSKSGNMNAPAVPHAATVKVETGAASPAPPSSEEIFEEKAHRSNTIVWLVTGFAGAVVLFFIGYFLIPTLVPQTKPQSGEVAVNPTSTLPDTAGSGSTFLGHVSYFQKEPDAKIKIAIGKVVNGVPQTYPGQLYEAFRQLNASSSIVEVELTDFSGNALAWNRFLELTGAAVLNPEIWQKRFEQDFTFFVEQTSDGLWPGYILKIRPGQSSFILKNEIIALESQLTALRRLFLTSPGSPQGDFKDAQIGGQAFRSLPFNSRANLLYGWPYGQYFILSTSETSLKRALFHF